MKLVKDKPGLVKDPGTNAVINTDTKAFLAARAAKKRILEANNKQDDLEERIKQLEKMVSTMMGSRND